MTNGKLGIVRFSIGTLKHASIVADFSDNKSSRRPSLGSITFGIPLADELTGQLPPDSPNSRSIFVFPGRATWFFGSNPTARVGAPWASDQSSRL